MEDVRLHPPAQRSKPLPRTRNRLLRPDKPQKPILQRNKHIKDLIAAKRQQDKTRRHARIHEIMVRRAHNRRQDQRRVPDTHDNEEEFPQLVLAALVAL